MEKFLLTYFNGCTLYIRNGSKDLYGWFIYQGDKVIAFVYCSMYMYELKFSEQVYDEIKDIMGVKNKNYDFHPDMTNKKYLKYMIKSVLVDKLKKHDKNISMDNTDFELMGLLFDKAHLTSGKFSPTPL